VLGVPKQGPSVAWPPSAVGIVAAIYWIKSFVRFSPELRLTGIFMRLHDR